ncbi:Major facilitator superfamily transporter [Coniochaeta hoffmannii]|uniref:Major facilitator superfamily transporter n=1 Tax=Coniochaeta hoffmannii TaxID=91930 RepID=A0AA38S608_9PEZI|nr:Major facilitator superfamily transporter [Coniochaeta hoffmannii]
MADTVDKKLVIAAELSSSDFEKGTVDIPAADSALTFLRNEAGVAVHVDEKKLVRKIDFMIIPLMWCAYFLQYLDKTLINYANVMGLQADTNTTPDQFSYLALAFYCSYLICEIPQGYLMQRFPTAKYLGVQIILWGLCVTMNCACKSFPALVAVRVLLGCFESAVAPALILITGMWYKKAEQPTRMGLWYLGTGTGTIVGALSSYGFQHYVGTTFKTWQIMFLMWGLITITVGVLIVVFLPDNPMTSKLTHDEKIFAIERLRSNKTGIENKTFKVHQMMECLKDPHTWIMALITASSSVTNGAVSSFQATIIKGLGYNSRQSALLSIPGGAVNIVSILSATYVAGRTNSRGINIICLITPAIIGGALMAFLPKSHGPAGPLIGNYMTNTIGAALPLLYAWVAANFAGHTKKVTMNAILLMSFCLGNIIGPLTFTGSSAPVYTPAKIAIMATGAVSIASTLLLLWKYGHENKKRDRSDLGNGEHVVDSEFMDLTDRQNLEFRYAL